MMGHYFDISYLTTAKPKGGSAVVENTTTNLMRRIAFLAFQQLTLSLMSYVRRKLETKQTNEQSIDNDSIKDHWGRCVIALFCSRPITTQPKQCNGKGANLKIKMRVLNISPFNMTWQLAAQGNTRTIESECMRAPELDEYS